jgi:hypothetical protein
MDCSVKWGTMSHRDNHQIGPSPGPTLNGRWAAYIPEHSGFSGTIQGVSGRWWKDPQALREISGRAEWSYAQQLGLWVADFVSLELV